MHIHNENYKISSSCRPQLCVRYLLSFYFNLFLDVILVKNSIFISSSAHFKFYKINKVCIFKKHIFSLTLQLHEVLDTKSYIFHIIFMELLYLRWYHTPYNLHWINCLNGEIIYFKTVIWYPLVFGKTNNNSIKWIKSQSSLRMRGERSNNISNSIWEGNWTFSCSLFAQKLERHTNFSCITFKFKIHQVLALWFHGKC